MAFLLDGCCVQSLLFLADQVSLGELLLELLDLVAVDFVVQHLIEIRQRFRLYLAYRLLPLLQHLLCVNIGDREIGRQFDSSLLTHQALVWPVADIWVTEIDASFNGLGVVLEDFLFELLGLGFEGIGGFIEFGFLLQEQIQLGIQLLNDVFLLRDSLVAEIELVTPLNELV